MVSWTPDNHGILLGLSFFLFGCGRQLVFDRVVDFSHVWQLAQSIGDPNLPRPWSRHSEGSSKFKPKSDDEEPTTSVNATGLGFTKTQGSKAKNLDDELGNDPQLREFIEVMQPRSKSKLWANDTTVSFNGSDAVSIQGTHKRGDCSKKKASVETKTVETFSRRVPINKGKGGEKLTQMHVRFEGSDSDESDDDELYEEVPVLDAPTNLEVVTGKADVDAMLVTDRIEDPVLKDEALTDLDYLKSRTKSGVWSDDEDEADGRDVKLDATEDQVTTANMDEDEEDEDESDDESKEEEEDEEDDEEEDGRDDGSVEDAVVDGAADNVVIAEIGQGDWMIASDQNDQSDEGQGTAVPVLAEEQESVSETGRLFVRNLPYTAT
jgi:multiple RNA-binding domain-containing protein 1